MKLVLPNALRFNIIRRGRRATIVYEEDFSSAALVKRTVAALPRVPDMVVRIKGGGKTARIVYRADYSQIANMIVGEFFCWSRFAEKTLRELMIESMLYASRSEEKPPRRPRQKP
jgi:hypothetical protein